MAVFVSPEAPFRVMASAELTLKGEIKVFLPASLREIRENRSKAKVLDDPTTCCSVALRARKSGSSFRGLSFPPQLNSALTSNTNTMPRRKKLMELLFMILNLRLVSGYKTNPFATTLECHQNFQPIFRTEDS